MFSVYFEGIVVGCSCCMDFPLEQIEDFRFVLLCVRLQKATTLTVWMTARLSDCLIGQGQEGGSVIPHSCFFFTNFCNLYPEYRFLSHARVRRNPTPESRSFPVSRQEFFAFSRIPDPEDTLPDPDGQQAQNILIHP